MVRGSVQRHAAPQVGGFVQVLLVVDGFLSVGETASRDDEQTEFGLFVGAFATAAARLTAEDGLTQLG